MEYDAILELPVQTTEPETKQNLHRDSAGKTEAIAVVIDASLEAELTTATAATLLAHAQYIELRSQIGDLPPTPSIPDIDLWRTLGELSDAGMTQLIERRAGQFSEHTALERRRSKLQAALMQAAAKFNCAYKEQETLLRHVGLQPDSNGHFQCTAGSASQPATVVVAGYVADELRSEHTARWQWLDSQPAQAAPQANNTAPGGKQTVERANRIALCTARVKKAIATVYAVREFSAELERLDDEKQNLQSTIREPQAPTPEMIASYLNKLKCRVVRKISIVRERYAASNELNLRIDAADEAVKAADLEVADFSSASNTLVSDSEASTLSALSQIMLELKSDARRIQTLRQLLPESPPPLAAVKPADDEEAVIEQLKAQSTRMVLALAAKNLASHKSGERWPILPDLDKLRVRSFNDDASEAIAASTKALIDLDQWMLLDRQCQIDQVCDRQALAARISMLRAFGLELDAVVRSTKARNWTTTPSDDFTAWLQVADWLARAHTPNELDARIAIDTLLFREL